MHISEGILTIPVLAGGAVLTAIGTTIGLKNMDYEKIMSTSLLTATFFVASLIHVPVGPGSVHLVLGGLLGILLGWSCFPAILVALLLQALLFQYGGIFVLGVNTFNMAAPPILCYYLLRPLLKKGGKKSSVAAFAAGFFSILFSSLLIASTLAISDQGFIRAAQATVLAHIPLMFIEGIITTFIISFLAKVQPEFLNLNKQ